MADADALPQLLQYRERRWLGHCADVLQHLLLPMAREWRWEPDGEANRGAVLIENRIDQQWLFTVLNTALMCPPDTQLCLITDAAVLPKAQSMLRGIELPCQPWWGGSGGAGTGHGSPRAHQFQAHDETGGVLERPTP